jgi:hypothetical protein
MKLPLSVIFSAVALAGCVSRGNQYQQPPQTYYQPPSPQPSASQSLLQQQMQQQHEMNMEAMRGFNETAKEIVSGNRQEEYVPIDQPKVQCVTGYDYLGRVVTQCN